MGSVEGFHEHGLFSLVGHNVAVTLVTGEIQEGFLEWRKGYQLDGKPVLPDSMRLITDFGVEKPRVAH